MYCLQSTVNEI